MTTFALIAGMMPVAIGLGEGGEFYRPMAVAIIGGTITSTLLTLLVVPTFYDSIEISKDAVAALYAARALRHSVVVAVILTVPDTVEAFVNWLWIRGVWMAQYMTGGFRRKPPEPKIQPGD